MKDMAQTIKDYFSKQPDRRMIIRTGIGGYDMFSEAIENQAGFVRVYIGRKVLRILRILKGKIHKSPRGIYYKLIKS